MSTISPGGNFDPPHAGSARADSPHTNSSRADPSHSSRRPRSATLGLLACFLGWIGLHNWFLGQKKRALGHLCLTLICLGLMFLAVEVGGSAAELASGPSDRLLRLSLAAGAALGALAIMILSYLVGICNAAWGFVEGVMIISRGDRVRRPVAAGTAYISPRHMPEHLRPVQLPSASPASAPYRVAPAGSQPIPPLSQASAPRPLSPATRRKFLIGGIIAGVVVFLAFAVAIIVALISQPDYEASYLAARDLREKILPLYEDYSCNHVVDYVNSTWYSEKVYDSYIEDCKAAFDGTDDLVTALGNTSGVRYDASLSSLYEDFRAQYDKITPDLSQFDRQLALYRAWHTFTVRVDDLTTSSSESEFRAAADSLISSGNDTLVEYGTGWLDKTLSYVQSYQVYTNSESSDESARLREAMLARRSEQRVWVSEHRPDIVKLVGLEFNGTANLYQRFRVLYNAIVDAYRDDNTINA